MEQTLTTDEWRLSDIPAFRDSESSARILIEIPKFQRGVVWKSDRIEKLVDSLFKMYPIGSLLAFESHAEGGKRRFQLIDGLQRSNAIAKFALAPLEYATAEHLFEEEVFEVLSSALELSREDHYSEAKSRLESWMRKIESPDHDDYLAAKLMHHISDGDPTLIKSLAGHIEVIERALRKARKRVDSILGMKVPVLIFWGPDENIPEIFERINSQGAKLTKYEILASSWIRTNTVISNPVVIKEIVEKYKSWIDQGFEVVDDVVTDEDDYQNGNLYEYLVGLSRFISKEFPLLFGAGSVSEDIAFQIVTVLRGLPVSKMRELPNQMARDDSTDMIDPTGIEAAVIQACGAISSRLSEFIGIRGNNVEDKNVGYHSQNQVISYITSLIVNAYDQDSGKCISPELQDRFLQNLPGHYLTDILRKVWKGSGDTRLFERTWSRDEESEEISASPFYLQPILREAFAQTFYAWNEEQLSKSQKSRATWPKEVLVVMKFLYSGVITALQERRETFEIEHIYPVKTCKLLIEQSDDQEGWPISAPGNLMYLPKPINRIKGKNLLGPEVKKLSESGRLEDHEERDLQTYLMVPQIEDIVASRVSDKTSFVTFCEARSAVMVQRIMENMNLKNK